MPQQSVDTFSGFVPPTRNYFPMPNEWIDICAEINNLAELKVIQYVLRHTWGFQEFGIKKTISIDEFMHGRKRKDGSRMDKGTGLKSDRSVRDGIELAISHGYLVCEVDYSDKARVKKSYALKMQPDTLVDSTTPVQSTTPVDATPLVDSASPTGAIHQSNRYNPPTGTAKSTSRSEKETLERHLRKTLEKERETPDGQPNASSLSPSSQSFSGKPALVSHPEHSFIWFDDLIAPSIMICVLTPAFPHRHWSDLEDKRRKAIASEVKHSLISKGLTIETRIDYEKEQEAVEANSSMGKQHTLLDQLTEEESAFWNRWCAVSGSDYNSLNQNAYSHVKFLAEKGLTTEELQRLYDYKYAQIREYSVSLGKSAIPPRLGNLVKAYPEWEKTREQKKREQEEDHKTHEHLPGTGRLRNFTQERIAGGSAPLPTQRRTSTAQKGNIDFDVELAKLRRRTTSKGETLVEKPQTP